MAKRKSKKSKNYLGIILLDFILLIWFIIKIPYYILKKTLEFVKWIIIKTKDKVETNQIKERREEMKAKYEDFKILKEETGNYKDWEKEIFKAESKMGIIVGARGSGKSAFGIKFLENLKTRENKNIYAMGFRESDMPNWIEVVSEVSQIKNDSFVLIDEGGIFFSARRAMSNANKILSELILVARHKNISILFISQNSSNLEVNILRQADFLVLKPSSLLQKDFERKIVQTIYEKAKKGFEKFKDEKGVTYIYSQKFSGFVSNPLPSFWNVKISKSFR